MNKAKVLVLGGLRDEALTDLKNICQVDIGPVGHRPEDDREWVLDHIAEYDGVIVAKMAFDREMIDAAKNLKIISTYGVGFDHVDVEYAKEKGIVVSNCPKSVLRPTAELAWTMIMASARRLHYYDDALREGVFLNADEYDNQGYSIEGKTLGIVGMGRIGQQVARFAKAFGMTIIYHNRHQVDDQIAAELDAKYVDLDTLAKEADFVSLHTPATAETYHLVNSDFLKKMKDTAFLINVARGSLIDGDALIAALKNGSIAGAALDDQIAAELDAKYVDLDTLAKEADFVSLHTPATAETYHLVNSDFLKKMKDTAFLINVARGSLIDGDALIAALKNGSIAGAALDVFENEPHPRPELVEMDNVIMTPHVGSATHIARFNLSKEAANNVLSFFKDGQAINQIN